MMKNNGILMFRLSFLALLILITSSMRSVEAPPAKQQYFELKIYSTGEKGQEAKVDAFLKNAYLPALHRSGISKAGVFKPIETDTAFGKLVYVFIPYTSVDQYAELMTKLENDKVYNEAGKDFLDAPYNDPPFVRYESVLMKAFSAMPQFKAPSYSTPAGERIYELRSYESATEAKAAKKRKMFNEGGEMAIFEKIGSNAVFYGQVIMGSQMPRLIYLTTYSDMKSHDEHWLAFRNHPEWKTLSAKEEYKNSTSKTKAFLTHPTDYSDF
jgi:hypothetical protein